MYYDCVSVCYLHVSCAAFGVMNDDDYGTSCLSRANQKRERDMRSWQTPVADPGGGGNPAMPPWGPWPDWLLSYCKLTSLTSFFCCDHHNNKRRLRFNTVFLWLTPTFLPDTFWLQGCGRWVHALIFYLSIVFSWV